MQRETFHGKYQYMFIESICNDHETLERNYRYKMKFSPDYAGVDMEAVSAVRGLAWGLRVCVGGQPWVSVWLREAAPGGTMCSMGPHLHMAGSMSFALPDCSQLM